MLLLTFAPVSQDYFRIKDLVRASIECETHEGLEHCLDEVINMISEKKKWLFYQLKVGVVDGALTTSTRAQWCALPVIPLAFWCGTGWACLLERLLGGGVPD